MNKTIIIKKAITPNSFVKMVDKSRKCLIVTSNDVFSLFKKQITKLMVKFDENPYFVADYSLNDAFLLAKFIISNRYKTIISFGGGTVNDVCKLAAKYSDVNLISVPTIISNDGVCSNISVLKVDSIHTDGFASKSPDTIVVDLDIIKKSPSKYLKAGICDILSNYTSVFDWDLAVQRGNEEKNDLARIMSSNAFWSLFNLPDNIEEDLRIRIICESIILSGLAMEIKGNTRPCSGSEHLFNHAMVAYYPEIKVLHGYLVGLGSLASCILQKQNFNKLVSFLKRNDIDVRPSTLGITKTVFVDAWKKAKDTRPNRYTILNEVELNDKILESIYDKIEKEAY